MLTVGSACSGVGCIDLGLERAGFAPVWQIEISPRRRDVLARHWPDVPRHNDLRTIDADQLVRPNLIAGGTPCQDLSVAGRGEGLDGSRSSLFIDFIRLADRQPGAWILWENVPGALYNRKGEDFALCLEGFIGARPGVPASGWKTAGFAAGPLRWCVWRVLDAQFFGVPQHRRRVFVVAGPRDQPRPEILLEPAGSFRPTPPRGAAKEKASCLTAGSPGGGCRFDDNETLIVQAYNDTQITNHHNRSGLLSRSPTLSASGDVGLVVYSRRGSVAPCLTAGHDDSQAGKSGDPGVCVMDDVGVRILTPRERERVQGLPDDWTRWGASGKEISFSARRRMTGDGAAVPVIEWIGRRLMKVLRTQLP